MHRFLQATLDALTTYIAVLDPEGNILVVNKAWRHFAATHHGTPLSFEVGVNYLAACDEVFQGIVGPHGQSVAEGLREVMEAQRETFGLEYPCHTAEGQCWFNLCVTRFDEEKPGRVVVAHEDISARKRAEDDLRRSEAKFRNIIEASPVPFALNDGQNITFLNAQFIRTFGYTLDDIKTLGDWWPKAYPDPQYCQWVTVTWGERLEKAREEGQAFEPLELHIHCKNGQLRTVMAAAQAIGDSLEETHLVILYDITQRKQAEQSLLESEALLRLATEAGSIGLWEWDVPTNRQNWNEQLKTIFGLPTDVTGLTTQMLIAAIHPEDVVETEAIFRAALQEGLDYEHSYRIVRPDGTVRWIAARGRGEYDELGSPVRMRGSAIDVTENKQAEEALRESEERFRASFVSAAIGKAIVGLDGRCLQVNQSLCDLLGYSETELLGLSFQDITHPDDIETGVDLVEQLVRGTRNSYQLEKRYFHKLRREIWVLLSVSVVRDRRGQPLYFVGEVVDITSQKQDLRQLQQANAQLHDLAHDDALTGLKNRRSFDEHLKQQIAVATRMRQKFSVLLFDLDHFKRLNDSFGHAAGDEVLRTIGSIIEGVIRPNDFFARYGGEEFALILPSTGAQGSIQAAERARRAIANYAWPSSSVTASFGAATWKGEDAQTLLVKADVALYAAKTAGRNRICHHSREADTVLDALHKPG